MADSRPVECEPTPVAALEKRLVRGRAAAGHHPVLVTEPLRDLPAPDWCRVRVTLAGVCGSDLREMQMSPESVKTPLPGQGLTYGHEIVGVVRDAGVDRFVTGARVAVHPLLTCRVLRRPECTACTAGTYGQCLSFGTDGLGLGKSLGLDSPHGGWAELVVAHPTMLRALPPELGDHQAVLAEPLSVAVAGLWSVAEGWPPPHIAVVGAGTLGQLVALAAADLFPDSRRCIVTRHKVQSKAARELGAADVLPQGTIKDVADWHGAANPRVVDGSGSLLTGPELVVDAAGSASSLATALALAGMGGTVLTLGNPAACSDLRHLWLKRLCLRGHLEHARRTSGDESTDSMSVAIALLSRWKHASQALVTHTFTFAEHEKSWALIARLDKQYVKIALRPD